MDASTVEKIRHKPLLSAPPSPSPDISDILDYYFHDQEEDYALAEKANGLSLKTRPPIPQRPNTVPLLHGGSELTLASTTHTITTTTTESVTPSKSIWKTAVDETVHFAGGLTSHPFESTKHFSILRHSSALVYYKGPSTSVVATIFSDTPLPPDRSLWLQRKGFSGNLGMNTSTLLRTSSNWIDVTPASEALVSDMAEQDERAWQRDLKKFSKKTSKHKSISKQIARETCIVRIPAAAADGYLRIVMCVGVGRKKVLCPSPVFRIASTSRDVSILRGASLSTLPLEAGLKAASVVGVTVVNKYIGPARAIVENRVQKYTDKVKPSFAIKHAEHIAYAKSGLQAQIQSLEQHYDGTIDSSYDPLHAQAMFDSDPPPEVVGLDAGPEKPFPIRLDGKVVQGTGQGQLRMGIPTANLSGIPANLLLRLNGIYIGWATVLPKKGLENVSHNWHEAIITVGPSPYAAPRVVTKNFATVHMIHNFGSTTFFEAKMKIIIMGYLRPMPRPDISRPPEELPEAVARDIDIALASLSREHWSPDLTVQRLKLDKINRSFSDKYVDARSQVQERVDSIPLHWAGVRTDAGARMDKVRGNGGLWIRR